MNGCEEFNFFSTLLKKSVYFTAGDLKEQNKIIRRPVRHVSMKIEANGCGDNLHHRVTLTGTLLTIYIFYTEKDLLENKGKKNAYHPCRY